jgi:AcrR family transcriptional regulator
VRNRTTRLDTEERKAQVLQIATNVFYRDGYEKASLREIAQKAAITKAAIYHHFKNKEEILFGVILHHSSELISDLKEISQKEGDPVEELREMLTKSLFSLEDNKASAKILMEDRHFLNKKHETIINRQRQEIFEIYMNKLNEIKSLGRLSDVNLAIATFSIAGAITFPYHWYDPKGEPSLEDLVDNTIKIMFYGLVRDEGRAIPEIESKKRELKMQRKMDDWWKNSLFFRRR